MLNVKTVAKEINDLTRRLIETGLGDDINAVSMQQHTGQIELSVTAKNPQVVLKKIPYHLLYDELCRNRNFNIKMLDGALIMMRYVFSANGKDLLAHRLAFCPSPNLDEYQNYPEKYDKDEIYADITDIRIVRVPFRFDYDKILATPNPYHPISHFTLGQYENCRIPVSAAVPPDLFIYFILRNFYDTSNCKFSEEINLQKSRFPREILLENEKDIYINFPE